MRKLQLFLAAAIISVGLFSCSSNSEFAKVKYLDKTYAKKQKNKHQPEKLNNEDLAKATAPALNQEEDAKPELMEVLEAMQPMVKEGASKEQVNKPATNLITKEQKKKVEAIIVSDSIDTDLSMEEIFAAVSAVKKLKKSKGIKGFLQDDTLMLILLVILAFILPPLAVYLKRGVDVHFWISLILTLLYLFAIGGFPYLIPIAIIHALLVVFEVF